MRNEFFLFANDKQLKHIVLRWSFAKKRPFQTDKRTEAQSVDPSVYLLGPGGTFFWIFQSSHGLHEKTSIVCQQYWCSFNIISTVVLGKFASSFPIRHTYLFHSIKDFGVFATEETVLNTIEKMIQFCESKNVQFYTFVHLMTLL